MNKFIIAIAFSCSFMFIFLGVILFIHLDKILGVMLFVIGIIYFFKYLPSNNKEYFEYRFKKLKIPHFAKKYMGKNE